jgi:hypothetical protein
MPPSVPSLGELVKVPLREIWSDEAASFTPWLAKAEHLKKLGDTLGMELEPEDEEVPVGPFSADILCKDTVDGSWVVIENQIEKTDHRHLGQILTYAAGLEAKTMVWVASKFTDEHRAALDWLNEHTTDEISFFGLEIEVWRIGDSAPAPKFNIVSKPNDWSKTVRAQAGEEGEITTHKRLQFEFWSAFREYVQAHSKLPTRKPGFRHWMSFSIGRSGFNLAAITSIWSSVNEGTKSPEVRADLYLSGSLAKKHFKELEKRKDEIQAQIDLPLRWHDPEGAKACRIGLRRDGDFTDRSKWPELFAWLLKYLEKLNAVFRPIVSDL